MDDALCQCIAASSLMDAYHIAMSYRPSETVCQQLFDALVEGKLLGQADQLRQIHSNINSHLLDKAYQNENLSKQQIRNIVGRINPLRKMVTESPIKKKE